MIMESIEKGMNMKRNRHFLSFALLSLIVGITSCSNEVVKPITSSSVKYSDCKTGIQNVVSTSEYIEYSTAKPNVLSLTHYNLLLNCAVKNFSVETKIVADTLKLMYAPIGNDANCICPRDINYSIEELPYAKYVVKIQLDNLPYATLNLDFTSSTKGVSILKKI